MDPDALDRLAALLDGVDDEAATDARQRARDIRAGLNLEELYAD